MEYGKPGEPIKGSAYVRDYCKGCGAPIRVSGKIGLGQSGCRECTGVRGHAGKRAGAPIDDVTGYQANAVRALEGS